MEFKTTIKFCLNYLTDSNDTIAKLDKLKIYILGKYSQYNFQGIHKGILFNEKNDLELHLNYFLNYIETHMVWDSNQDCYTLNPGEYNGNSIDLEEREIEFDSSFLIDDDGEHIFIFLNTEDWYASELESLPNAGIDISCEMCDVDGDWYEFEI